MCRATECRTPGRAYDENSDLKPSPNLHIMTDYRRHRAGRLGSSGSIVIVCKPNAQFDTSLVEILCAALDDERIAIAQPLNLASDTTPSVTG
jgi:hypothetical protein